MKTILVDGKVIDIDEEEIINFLVHMGKIMHQRELNDDYELALKDLFDTYDLHDLVNYICENDDDLIDYERSKMR